MRAIVTVVGPDRVGIIAEVCVLLSKLSINIVDISQTVMDEFFTMMMLTDLTKATVGFDVIAKELEQKSQEMGLSIRIQREDIFESMHRI